MKTPENARREERHLRECLRVAWLIVKRLRAMDEPSLEDVTRTYLDAAQAISKVPEPPPEPSATDAEDDADPGIYADHDQILATAFWMLQLYFEDDDTLLKETHPYSKGGTIFLGFAAAIRLVEACSQVSLTINDIADDGMMSAHQHALARLVLDHEMPELRRQQERWSNGSERGRE